MANVFDVAKYILGKTGSISTLKLQKLVYYSQAWAVAWTEKPLFPERIEAWMNGPVCPDLYREHEDKFMIYADDLQKGDENALTDDEKDTVNRVVDYYGNWLPYELRAQTHFEDPWKIARGDLPDDVQSDNEITTDSMGTYYGSL